MKGDSKEWFSINPLNFHLKNATHAFPVWTNKQNPFVPKDNQLVCPNRESSPTLNIARCWCLPPHPFWQSHRKTLQNQWVGEERPSRKSLNAQTQPSFSWKSEKKFPTKSDAKNEIVSTHPQALQDTIPFSASNFPSLKAALMAKSCV